MADTMQRLRISSSSIEGGGGGGDDDFYEKIEAPKFVDFTKPDRRRCNDDRYWFCLRVGCDQKHEEEMDYEAISKNFVLRVMAARSPNVRFQKALCKRSQSSNMKCPLTAPPKSSKTRISRLAVISSVSRKLIDDKKKPIPKSNKTPKPEVKKSSAAAKALTTPRNKRRLSKVGAFRSARNPKAANTTLPKNRVVAKALIFDSPKKAEKTKNLLKPDSTMNSLCSGMKKLKITSARKYLPGYNDKPLDSARKQVKGREVKSRVFDALSKNCKGQETKSNCVKEKKMTNTVKDVGSPVPQGEIENDSSDASLVDKARAGMDHQSNSNDTEPRDTDVPDPPVLRGDGENLIGEGANDDKENHPASDGKENNKKLSKNNDSASAPDNNGKHNLENKHPNRVTCEKHHETPKTPTKVSQALNKNLNKSSNIAVNAVQGAKLKKPKLTNPKPFRFRTDERGILKEANLGRKLHPVEPSIKEQNTNTTCSETSSEVQEVLSRQTPHRQRVKDKEETHSESLLRRTRSPTTRVPKFNSPVSSEKEMAIMKLKPGQLSVIPETTILRTEKTENQSETGASPMEKSSASRSLSREKRRPATIPKEPVFHRLHVPRSCTRNVA